MVKGIVSREELRAPQLQLVCYAGSNPVAVPGGV